MNGIRVSIFLLFLSACQAETVPLLRGSLACTKIFVETFDGKSCEITGDWHLAGYIVP